MLVSRRNNQEEWMAAEVYLKPIQTSTTAEKTYIIDTRLGSKQASGSNQKSSCSKLPTFGQMHLLLVGLIQIHQS